MEPGWIPYFNYVIDKLRARIFALQKELRRLNGQLDKLEEYRDSLKS